MEPISTFVFIDLETTGFPWMEHNKTKITELALVSVRRHHLIDTKKGSIPRVLHKLTLCFNPQRMIQNQASEVTGLSNELLEFERPFDKSSFFLLNEFLNQQTKPTCFVAHNGDGFDYKILRTIIRNIGEKLSDDILSVDSFHAFHTILMHTRNGSPERTIKNKDEVETVTLIVSDEADDLNQVNNTLCSKSLVEGSCNHSQLQQTNETTPKHQKIQVTNRPLRKDKQSVRGNPAAVKARRQLQFSQGISFKLSAIYERLLNKPALNAHNAENDCMLLLACAVATSKSFVQFADASLLAVAALWGGTNPMIKKGSEGIKNVKRKTRLGQFVAEVWYLLTNWKYILPFLLNQSGSVLYFLTLQSAQLSLAVPITNSLTFVFTALSGWLLGEKPIDKNRLCGMMLVVCGTALCCLDKTLNAEAKQDQI